MAVEWSIPVKTDWMKTQAGHKPSMQYAKDIYKVASRLKNFTALEIGAAWGLSALAILEAGAKHLTSVDNNTQVEAPAEAKANGYDNYAWSCIKSEEFWRENPSIANQKEFSKASPAGVEFDLIYVDGSHLYKDVKNDLYQAWERLRPGGLLMVDDWDHKQNRIMDGDETVYGVSLACWEFWRDHPCEAGIEGRVLWFKK